MVNSLGHTEPQEWPEQCVCGGGVAEGGGCMGQAQ